LLPQALHAIACANQPKWFPFFMPTILTILAEGFEEVEAVTPIDLLRRAGAEVTVAALVDGMHVTSRGGLTMHTDTTLSVVATRDFDCVFLPGGPGVKHLRADSRVRDVILRHSKAGRWIAAICAAPTVLHDAGLLKGRRYTAHYSVANELPAILADQRVVVDDRLLTSRGAGTALDFGLLLVEKLFSAEKSAEVARSICA
jgi:4-methyl-5(b-hydroxyethyl)-thiazole monophosphate biosynthesis